MFLDLVEVADLKIPAVMPETGHLIPDAYFLIHDTSYLIPRVRDLIPNT